MKKIFFTLIFIAQISFSAFALDPNLDPNQDSGYSGATATDITLFINSENKKTNQDCEGCHTNKDDRYANTVTTGAGKTAKPSSSGAGTQ